MKKQLIAIYITAIVIVALFFVVRYTTPDNDINPSIEYTQKEKTLYLPSFTNEKAEVEVLITSTEYGSFISMTTDKMKADAFVNAQHKLMRFLKDNGVAIRELNYVANCLDDSFSESTKDSAYIAHSATETWKQVLVTLQTLWGDYTDYGYVYAMSNVIAYQLEWETDTGWKINPSETIEIDNVDACFRSHPEAISLLYPVFTQRYTAADKTDKYAKLLSCILLDQIDWKDALKKPIETQLDDFAELIQGYAEKIGVTYSRPTCGYAYRGQYLPLCIQTTYVTHIIDHGYQDHNSNMFEDYFSDYTSIYQTAELMDREVVEAIERFGLEDRAGNFTINWLSEKSAKARFGRSRVNTAYTLLGESYVTTSYLYLYQYYTHIAYLMNPDSVNAKSWHTIGFCDIGRSYSWYSRYGTEQMVTQDPEMAEAFYSYTGHSYQGDMESYFEAHDVWTYELGDYSLENLTDGSPVTSFTYYLIRNYGEDAVCNLLLYPDTVMEVTGTTWEVLQNAWKESILNKYTDMEVYIGE